MKFPITVFLNKFQLSEKELSLSLRNDTKSTIEISLTIDDEKARKMGMEMWEALNDPSDKTNIKKIEAIKKSLWKIVIDSKQKII